MGALVQPEVRGVRKSRAERRVAALEKELSAALSTVEQRAVETELRELGEAGATRRALLVWRLHRLQGWDEHAIAQQLRMTLAAVRKSLERTSDRLHAWREANRPDLPDPADYQPGTGYETWLTACADAVIDHARQEAGARRAVHSVDCALAG